MIVPRRVFASRVPFVDFNKNQCLPHFSLAKRQKTPVRKRRFAKKIVLQKVRFAP